MTRSQGSGCAVFLSRKRFARRCTYDEANDWAETGCTYVAPVAAAAAVVSDRDNCCAENVCTALTGNIPTGYTVGDASGTTVSGLGALACAAGYDGTASAACATDSGSFVLSGCALLATCGDADGEGAGNAAATCPAGYKAKAGVASTSCIGTACDMAPTNVCAFSGGIDGGGGLQWTGADGTTYTVVSAAALFSWILVSPHRSWCTARRRQQHAHMCRQPRRHPYPRRVRGRRGGIPYCVRGGSSGGAGIGCCRGLALAGNQRLPRLSLGPEQPLGKSPQYRWHLGCILLKMPAKNAVGRASAGSECCSQSCARLLFPVDSKPRLTGSTKTCSGRRM